MMKTLFKEMITRLNMDDCMKHAVIGIYESTMVSEELINSAREKAQQERELSARMQSYADTIVNPIVEQFACGISHSELRQLLIDALESSKLNIVKMFGENKVSAMNEMVLKTFKRKTGTNVDLKI